MTPWLDDGDVRLYHGAALEVVREMADESVDTVVTSPPYWGLRDYGIDGQMGLEETPDLFVAGMVELFREIRRVLSPHGTCWVNLGDSYAQSGGNGDQGQGGQRASITFAADGRLKPANTGILKPKDLVGIPWRVAFALQADGWWLRSDIIWAKPNPMPESVTDRPTKAHEYVFLLTKQPRYWFDTEAVREPSLYAHDPRADNGRIAYGGKRNGDAGTGQESFVSVNSAGRNVRSVWQIATQPYPEAHFATYPEELARRCILAGCPVRVCKECRKPSERILERKGGPSTRADRQGVANANSQHGLQRGGEFQYSTAIEGSCGVSFETVGWSECDCGKAAADDWKWRPGVVLDPFIGSGTTAKVARDHQRHAIGIDLNLEYLELAARRLQQLSLLTGDAA